MCLERLYDDTISSKLKEDLCDNVDHQLDRIWSHLGDVLPGTSVRVVEIRLALAMPVKDYLDDTHVRVV